VVAPSRSTDPTSRLVQPEESLVNTPGSSFGTTQPYGVAITPDGRHAYVTNTATPGSTVSVIDTTSNTVTATIDLGQEPYGVAITPDGRHAYVTNHAAPAAHGSTISVIDTTSNTVTCGCRIGHPRHATWAYSWISPPSRSRRRSRRLDGDAGGAVA
jgi:YVTN family beta-propeller protein